MWDKSKNMDKGQGSTQWQSRHRNAYNPKRPVFTFRDLEVYQKTMEASVIIMKNLKNKLKVLKYDFIDNFVQCSMSVPMYLGEGHSLRFGDHKKAILLLENAMAGCNKMVIYLEQIKGIYGSKIDQDLIDDLIKRYADVRGKIFRLEKAWQKFEPPEK